jgi:TfoX/Sxy family transcriptional regulator of competence genes
MTAGEKTRARVRERLAAEKRTVEEKKMFSGHCFMVNDKMCVCVNEEQLLVRYDPARDEEMLEKEGAHPMEMKGKPMKGYIWVDIDAVNTAKKLEFWVQAALEFNDRAKSSKKPVKKKK